MTLHSKTHEALLRLLLGLWVILALAASALADEMPGRAFPEADRIFHADPRWLGGDDASSIKLSDGRFLWLFGDSFVAPVAPYTRTHAAFIHNSIAIQSGDDPRTAAMHFVWRHTTRGVPAPYFTDRRSYWYWPSGGIRLEHGPLIVFLNRIVATPGRGLGFAVAGYALARVVNPDVEPEGWRMTIKDQSAPPFDALPGSAVVVDDSYAVALAVRQRGQRDGALVRYPLAAFARGDLSSGRWWIGNDLWQPAAQIRKRGPEFVLSGIATENSLHWDARFRAYVLVTSYGFGATEIGMQISPLLQGRWSGPRMIYRPPESNAARPFVYAGKAHPDLKGPDAQTLLVTYVANSFEPKDLLTPEGERTLYWPHFVAVLVGENRQ